MNTLTVDRSTISDNLITGANGRGAGAHIYFPTSSATIDESTISGNAITGPAGQGAGIYSRTNLDLTHSTVSEKTNSGTGGRGGGIYANWAMDVTNATISGNQATDGAAFYRASGTSDIIASTIVASSGNSSIGGSAALRLKGTVIGPGGTAACSNAVTSQGYNIGFDTSCGLSTGTGSDLQNTNALLGPLADNSGPTFTHLPGALSPARDSIPAGTPGLCDGTLPTDQRGVARPQGSACDRGSVEQ